MCGIAGIVRAGPGRPVEEPALLRMAASLRHRGPDGFGLARGQAVGLVSTRLAILDLSHGWQPMRSQAGSVLVYNGEVYNHAELRAELSREGASFRTRTDTEVVHAMLDRRGLDALAAFNGQFALGLWEPDDQRLTLVRDRFGVRPLHYALTARGDLVFGSEVTAVLASGEVSAAPDLEGIDDVFTTWGPRPPRSAFRGIGQLRPGGVLVWERGRIVREGLWWRPDVACRDAEPTTDLGDLLRSSVGLRLQADVRVGTYLSGGLDSSLLTALAREVIGPDLRTFSLAFESAQYDESAAQQRVAGFLGTQHHVLHISARDIAAGFRDAVLHAATPLVRTGPVCMAQLARFAREHGVTVVATGEGADELFWGYDVFKEVLARRAYLRDPELTSAFDDLYPHLGHRARGPGWQHAFAAAGPADDPLFSHQVRMRATGSVAALYAPDVVAELDGQSSRERLRRSLPPEFTGWTDLQRTTWLELHTLLEPYLLAAQGDRAAMTHGVEGRYPFLDHRVFDHAMSLRPDRKLRGSQDKAVLRELAASVLPAEITNRRKQPYRAPEVAPFVGPDAPEWVQDSLTPTAVRAAGLFDPTRVEALMVRCGGGRALGQREAMAFVGVLSTQVWSEQHFGAGVVAPEQEARRPRVFLELDDERAEATA
ncbi:MAG: asparagine synthase (glutamine-hydrolyzing) [Frankiales bacterium]|nr:asparagine synthase (glutamine-hydrolyzing) [Frankiales bacterium]